MADQTITVTSDVDVHIDGGTPNREGNGGIKFKQNAPNRNNIFFRFDVTSLAGKMWDSVFLNLTVSNIFTWLTTGPLYLARVRQPMVYTTVTDLVYDTGMSWGSAGGQSSVDNDYPTRVDIFSAEAPSTVKSVGSVVTSLDITTLVRDALQQDSGILDIIYYGGAATSGGTSHQYRAIEIGPPATDHANLFFSNVQAMESTTSSNPSGTASNVAVPSASSLSKSGRPPIAGADRQYSATILHDGVEPMNILSITLRGTFGADN